MESQDKFISFFKKNPFRITFVFFKCTGVITLKLFDTVHQNKRQRENIISPLSNIRVGFGHKACFCNERLARVG